MVGDKQSYKRCTQKDSSQIVSSVVCWPTVLAQQLFGRVSHFYSCCFVRKSLLICNFVIILRWITQLVIDFVVILTQLFQHKKCEKLMCIALLVAVLRCQGCCHGGCNENRFASTPYSLTVSQTPLRISHYYVHLLSTLYDFLYTISKSCRACVSKGIVVTQALDDTVGIAIVYAIPYGRRKKSS